MHSEELISHPDLQPLMKKFKKKFPKIDLKMNMTWKDDISDMLMDWWEGKIAYYKYKG